MLQTSKPWSPPTHDRPTTHKTEPSSKYTSRSTRSICTSKKVGMPPATKYGEFIVSEPFQAKKKHKNEDVLEWYCSITCPYCDKTFVQIPQSSLASNRAGGILKHIRVCTAYQGEVKPAPEKKKDEMDILRKRAEEAEERAERRHQEAMRLSKEQHDAMMKRMEDEKKEAEQKQRLAEKRAAQRHKQTLQAIWDEHGHGQPPPIRDQADLNDRLSRKRRAERGHSAPITEALKRICQDERQAKRLRSVLHPDGNSANSADLDMVRNALGL